MLDRRVKRKGETMYYQQSDILQGLDENFITKFMKIAKEETCTPGHVLYKAGDRAIHFYILMKGRVKLSIGEEGHTVYTVDQQGEVFGLSGLIGHEKYTALAECRETATLLRIKVKEIVKLLQDNAPSGLIFYRNLSGSLGNRLLQTYKLITGASVTDASHSYGTGQLLESDTKAKMI